MDKLKAVFSPGSKADDSVLYGDGNADNMGKVTGEGSHFGHSRTTEPSATTAGSGPTGTSGPADTSAIDTSKPAASNTGAGIATLSSDQQKPSIDATTAAQLASKPQAQEATTVAPSSTQDTKDTTASLAASRAENSRQTQDLPDRTAGAGSGDPSHPIYDEFTTGPPGSTSHPQARAAASSAAGTTAPTSTSSANPYSSRAIDPRIDPAGSAPQKEHHVGRDAALGTAATGAAAHGGDKIHQEHEQRNAQPVPSTSQTVPSAGSKSRGEAVPPPPAGMSQTSYDPKSGSATYSVGDGSQPDTLGTRSEPTQQEQHHYGRDAAIGAGVGAAGVGGYEATKHHDASSERPTTTVGPQSQAPTSSSQRLPPSAISEPRSTALESQPQQQQQSTSTGYYTGPQGTAVGNDKPSDHHYGRDAALGAGAGAAGVGGYEGLKHDSRAQPETGATAAQQPAQQGTHATAQPSSTQTSVPGQAISTDTRQPASAAHEGKSDEHHYGRDAAIGAGAVGAGAAAYEAKKHEDEKKALEQQQQAEKEHQKQLAAEEKAHAKEQKKAEKEHEKAVKQHEKEVKKEEKQHEKEIKKEEKQHEKELKKQEKQHEKEVKDAEAEREKQAMEQERAAEEERKRREKEAAAAAGGVGTAGVAAAEYERKKDQDNEEDETGEGKKKSKLLGIFSRDKKDKEHEDAEATHDSHKKEEAATGVGAVGAAGLGKHEYDKHREAEPAVSATPATTQSTDTAESEEGKKKGGLLSKILHPDKDKDTEDDAKHDKHRKEEEAAVGAGAVGAAGLGKHEHDKHKEAELASPATTERTDTAESDDGKKKGGLLSKILHPGKKDTEYAEAEKPKDHHREKEAAAGAGAVGAAALGKHEYDEHKDRQQPSTVAGESTQAVGGPTIIRDDLGRLQARDAGAAPPPQTSAQPPTGEKVYTDSLGRLHRVRDETAPVAAENPTDKEQSHHYGRDAAIGAGAIGAGAVGKQEYDNRHQEASQAAPQTQTTTASRPIQQTEPTVEPQDKHPQHHKEVAAGAATVGAGAAAKHEHDKHKEQALGASQGQAHEGYHHEKTDKDIAAEKRNEVPVAGELHREGRLHGKEGGAPGAVGVKSSERDETYADTQRHGSEPEGEHKKHGILGGIFHRQKDDKETDTSESHSDRHRLHKDPPADHLAASTTTDPTTGLPIDGSKGPHDGSGTDGLPYGHHAQALPDNMDVNVQHPLHDAGEMGYGAHTSGRYNV